MQQDRSRVKLGQSRVRMRVGSRARLYEIEILRSAWKTATLRMTPLPCKMPSGF